MGDDADGYDDDDHDDHEEDSQGENEREDAERRFDRFLQERNDFHDQTKERLALHGAARIDRARAYMEAEELSDEVTMAKDEVKDDSGVAARYQGQAQ